MRVGLYKRPSEGRNLKATIRKKTEIRESIATLTAKSAEITKILKEWSFPCVLLRQLWSFAIGSPSANWICALFYSSDFGLREFGLRPLIVASVSISAALVSPLSTLAADSPGFEAKGFQARGFKVADHYPPPHETQIKSLLEGGIATPLGAGKTLLSDGVTLQTFTETNTLQIRVMAPQCLYDSVAQTASSAGPLRMQTPDGKSIEGEGFLWQQTNSSLFISNRVHTMLRSDALGFSAAAHSSKGQAADESPSEVFSHQFAYNSISSDAVYNGDVRVTGTNLNMTCGTLKIAIPKNERQLQSVTAEHDVIVDYQGIQADFKSIQTKGQRAEFSSRTGLVRITGGQPTWMAGTRGGGGNELILDRTNGIFQAKGDAHLKMAGQSVIAAAGSGFEPGNTSSNRLVDVVCDNYELRTNLAIFRKEVRVTERAGDEARGKLNCELMTLTFTSSNELRTLVAETNVVIAQSTNRFLGGKAVFIATNGLLELTENPSWQSGPKEGKGDVLRVDTRNNEMWVRGAASMRLPAEEFAGDLLPQSSNQKPQRGPKAGPPQFADITSTEYTLTTNSAHFQGGVHVCHPRMEWVCDELTVQSSRGQGKPESIVADQKVKFGLEKENGEMIYGFGDKAVYSFGVSGAVTNELLTLTGNKAILIINNQTNRNDRIIYDRANNSIAMPGGGYRSEGVAPASVDTNMFTLPKKRPHK